MFENHTAVIAKSGVPLATSVRVYTLGSVEPMTTPNPPPTAKLLDEARKRMSPPLTTYEAAQRANVGEGTWRNAARGLRYLGAGRVSTYEPDPPVLARMARVVGITPDDLRQIGRDEAAKILERTAEPAASALSAFGEEELLQELVRRARDRATPRSAAVVDNSLRKRRKAREISEGEVPAAARDDDQS